MTDDERRKEEERRKKRERERLQSKLRQSQELVHRRKYRSLNHKNHDRRKKDCMIGMPFIVAYQGDPTMPFFCNDVRDVNNTPTYDLIYNIEKPYARLERYLAHHVVSIHAKILIYKAGPDKQCPVCGIGYLIKCGDGIVRCDFCGYRQDKQYTK